MQIYDFEIKDFLPGKITHGPDGSLLKECVHLPTSNQVWIKGYRKEHWHTGEVSDLFVFLRAFRNTSFIIDFYGWTITRLEIFLCFERLDMSLYQLYCSFNGNIDQWRKFIVPKFFGYITVSIINALNYNAFQSFTNSALLTNSLFFAFSGLKAIYVLKVYQNFS